MTVDFSQYGLGRNESPLDINDWKLGTFEPPVLGDLTGTMLWPFNANPLNQKSTNHCCGFGGADFGICDPIPDPYTDEDGHRIYYMCKDVDGEPGQENGSTVHTLAKVLQNMGRIKNYAFANLVDEVTWWLLHKGPVIVGTEWTNDMFISDADNIIHPTGEVAGGHCYVLRGTEGNLYYTLQNSWNGWGINGGARISIADFRILFRHHGEALASVEEPIPVQAPDVATKCWLTDLFNQLLKPQPVV